MIILAILTLGTGLKVLEPFLAPNQPIDAKILVIEGWLPDYALQEALAEFKAGDYDLLVTSGGPLLVGFFLSEYDSYAQLSAETLRKMGMEDESLVAIPAPLVESGRTISAARAVKKWLEESSSNVRRLNILSLGSHARRTHFLFESVFGDQYRIGVIAVDDQEYDSKRWWASSGGFRNVTGEAVAYLYWWIKLLIET